MPSTWQEWSHFSVMEANSRDKCKEEEKQKLDSPLPSAMVADGQF